MVNGEQPGSGRSGRASESYHDPQSHELTLINQVQSLGQQPTHSSLAADRHLFVTNYSVLQDPGGSLAILPVDAEGALAAPVQLSGHPASRVNPERQASDHVHSMVSSPDGKYRVLQAWVPTRFLPTVTTPSQSLSYR